MGYPTLILLSICISNGYRKKTTHTGTLTETHTETHTEKYCFGVPADKLWFHKIQVMMTRMKRTTCMVWWLSLRFQLQRYNKKLSISKFSRISATNPPTKWCVWTGERFCIPPCKDNIFQSPPSLLNKNEHRTVPYSCSFHVILNHIVPKIIGNNPTWILHRLN